MTFSQTHKYVHHGKNLFNFNLGSHNANNLMIKKIEIKIHMFIISMHQLDIS